MLLSTSGSTGSPKLVRLSAGNVRSNAEAVAASLRLRPQERAVTTMPLHYCYGLSVLHSHLMAGAGLLLSERSVVEEEFWTDFAAAGATSFAGVPYTFDLLDATGFAQRSVPGLRRVTQAGGRLAPDRVRAYARLGRERGFELVVMYGQTEATARMAYLPAHLVEQAAGTIGVPVPGGRFRVDAQPGETVGELVFSGPGVMLGYAGSPADLAVGRTVHELRTGDRARVREDGLVEVVGRMDRVVKVFGLRVDLDRVETLLSTDRVPVRAVGLGERLVLFVTAARHQREVRARAGEVLSLPPHAVQVHVVAAFPRTSTGKPDSAVLVRYAADLDRAAGHGAGTRADGPAAVAELYRELLGRPAATSDDSFATTPGLQPTSLSAVREDVRVEAVHEVPQVTSGRGVVGAALDGQDGVPAGQRREVGDDRLQRRRRLQQHEPSNRAQLGPTRSDQLTQGGVGDVAVTDDQGGGLVAPLQQVRTDPPARVRRVHRVRRGADRRSQGPGCGRGWRSEQHVGPLEARTGPGEGSLT